MTTAVRLASLIVGLVLALPSLAAADDLDEFLAARDAFVASEFEIAATRFERLLSSDPPVLRELLIEPARRYYAAALISLNRRDEAVRLVEQILHDNPDAQVDEIQFSLAVLELFRTTRARLAPELARIREERRHTLIAEQVRRQRQRQLLNELATQESVVMSTPRWLMFIPFGVGQFANGDNAFGALFFGVETAALATALTSFAVSDAFYPSGVLTTSQLASDLRTTNVVAWSLLGASVLSGILHANLTYRREQVRVRPRQPPPGFESIQIAADPSPRGPVSVGLTIRF